MKHLLSSLAVAAAAALGAAPALADPVITFTPSSSTINVGESVNIDMTITGLGNEILAAFDFNVLWDSSIVTWSMFSVVPGCSALGAGSLCSIDTFLASNLGANGTSVLTDDELAAAQGDSVLIAQFTFVGASAGLATITLGADPDFQRNFVGRDFLTLATTVGSASICVRSDLGGPPGGGCDGGTAPEPASYGLAAMALLAAGWASRGRRRQPAAA